MSLAEYLYVDDRRLDKYVEQIGSLITYDKVPIWTATLSLLGPAAEGTQQRTGRPLRQSEKINRLLDYLKKHDLLAEGRFTGRNAFTHNAKMFRLETCLAVKTFIPPATPETLAPKESEWVEDYFPLAKEDPLDALKRKQRLQKKERERALARAREAIADFSGLNIWISDHRHAGPSNPEKSGQLFLIVGFPKDDVNSIDAWSAYSAFTGLRNELASELAKSVLHNVAHESDNPTSEFQQSFLADPLKSLRSLGARVGDWREITTLYRVRDAILYKELGESAESIATVGYPIYIAATSF